jgi:hypothetical protein
LTQSEVVSLVGDLDAGTIASIIETGATYSDLEQALALIEASGEPPSGTPITPAAEAVYDILETDPSFLGADRDR